MSSVCCTNSFFARQIRDLVDMNVLLLMADGTAAFGRLASANNRAIFRLVPPVGLTFPSGINAGVVFRPANPNLPCPQIIAQLLIDICDVAFIVWGNFLTIPLLYPCLSDENCAVCPPAGPLYNNNYANPINPGTTGATAGVYNATTINTGMYGFGGAAPYQQTNYRTDDERQANNTNSNLGAGISQGYSSPLVQDLKELIVRNISLVTIGGWTVTGQLGQIQCGAALLTPATANIPYVATQGALVISGPAIPANGLLEIHGSVSAWANLAVLTQVLQP